MLGGWGKVLVLRWFRHGFTLGKGRGCFNQIDGNSYYQVGKLVEKGVDLDDMLHDGEKEERKR